MVGGRDMRSLLAEQGFNPPDPWLDYARRRGFRPVPAQRLAQCPQCGSGGVRRLGQYVYFSHLARLCECPVCALVYSDLRLPDAVNADHFEASYKDEDYFERARAAVNRQLVRLVTRSAAEGARVLDVGAATGRLMAGVRRRRPDLWITVSDISQAACRRAERSGLAAVCSDIAGLRPEQPFDVVVMSDVIYQEPDLGQLWAALPRLVAPGGVLIVRLPNKLSWIRLYQRSLLALAPQRAAAQDRVPLFNPEHLYVFAPGFLRQRLHEQGFADVRSHPARSLRGGPVRTAAAAVVDAGAWAAYRLLPGTPVLAPSRIMTGRRPRD